MILSLTLASVAFAGQSESYAIRGDAQSGSMSDGIHGFSWYHANTDQCVDNDGKYRNPSDYDQDKIARLERILHRYNQDNRQRHRDYDRDNERYFYVDGNGVNHYFALDPDREYAVHQYKDCNGETQYWFEVTGWK
ncbi:MAG: hypothetical protein PHO01_11040 [Desulfotomaculaceae bacterium]|nr:hypothetical protein [Desulfotomaculaceae bacterium]